MDKLKRVFAWVGIIILVMLYIVTIVSAIFVTPATQGFFKASLLATIMIPILFYVYLLVYRLLKGRNTDGTEKEEIEPEKDKGFAEVFDKKTVTQNKK